ncbi:MAG: hypothetical protein AVDCRST_MAG11-2302, partial [uncultured Gemmatimonadaceae bacterium]
ERRPARHGRPDRAVQHRPAPRRRRAVRPHGPAHHRRPPAALDLPDRGDARAARRPAQRRPRHGPPDLQGQRHRRRGARARLRECDPPRRVDDRRRRRARRAARPVGARGARRGGERHPQLLSQLVRRHAAGGGVVLRAAHARGVARGAAPLAAGRQRGPELLAARRDPLPPHGGRGGRLPHHRRRHELPLAHRPRARRAGWL